MIVYGDHARRIDPRAHLARLREPLPAGGLIRHAAIAGKLVIASELAQGIADAMCDGRERRTDAADAALEMCCALARALARSWRGADPEPALWAIDPRDRPRDWPSEIQCRRAEGFAFYAVYPELYLAAAERAVADDPAPRRVIGIRSIGAGLAAIVAVATGAPLPATVRPTGHPFRREVAVADELAAEWLAPGEIVAIVDEGPGLSGSSFGAVADLVEDRGAARLELYPSHGGDLGGLAAPRHIARWRRVPRRIAAFEAVVLPRLARWIAALVGPLLAPLEDISAGAWRAHRFTDERAWPACVTQQERRKYLARTAGGMYLARFAGIGESGEATLAIARRLHAAGFTPEPIGLCHGFLIERWIDRARSIASLDRRWVIDRVADYLAFRARAFPGGDGADPATLAMARTNAGLALDAPRTSPRRIAVDGRLHAWEWLVGPDGALWKADAYDHHTGHDLIGCQDVAWDVAGAAVELALDPREERRLVARVGEVDGAQLAFARGCYLAFQIGRHALALDASPPAERARLQAQIERYRALLR